MRSLTQSGERDSQRRPRVRAVPCLECCYGVYQYIGNGISACTSCGAKLRTGCACPADTESLPPAQDDVGYRS